LDIFLFTLLAIVLFDKTLTVDEFDALVVDNLFVELFRGEGLILDALFDLVLIELEEFLFVELVRFDVEFLISKEIFGLGVDIELEVLIFFFIILFPFEAVDEADTAEDADRADEVDVAEEAEKADDLDTDEDSDIAEDAETAEDVDKIDAGEPDLAVEVDDFFVLLLLSEATDRLLDLIVVDDDDDHIELLLEGDKKFELLESLFILDFLCVLSLENIV